MSYDLEIWSVRELNDPPVNDDAKWLANDGGWSLSSNRWQLVLDHSCHIEPEDVPQAVARALPGIAFLTRLYLEGEAAPPQIAKAKKVAKGIAKALHGVVVDQQNEELLLPSGLKRILPVEREERFTSLTFTWWFLEDSPLASGDGLEAMLELVERVLPELLPSRYGPYEPLPYKYSETGREHFLQFFKTEIRNFFFWKPAKPFGIHLGFPKQVGASSRGFRTNYIEVSVDAALLHQPGWQAQLHLFWQDFSALAQPIYGDVRLLRGQPRNGWYLPNDPERDEHPVRTWFWRGVPATLGVAVVLGGTYQLLWPEAMKTASLRSGLAFLSIADWTSQTDLAQELPPLPQGIISPCCSNQQAENIAASDADYPSQWPFGPTFAPREPHPPAQEH